MTWLFSSRGKRMLNSLSAQKTLFAFDFDGTLAPIIQNPASAAIPALTKNLLKKLSRYAHVSVVSGRGRKNLSTKLKLSTVFLIGNHGLEGVKKRSRDLKRAQKLAESWEANLKAFLPVGVKVENKKYTLSLHFRGFKKTTQIEKEILKSIRHLDPKPRIIHGKKVINLVAAGSIHKGVALIELMKHLKLKSALYVGDDVTDEDAFVMKKVCGIRVGKKNASEASFFLKNQSEINRLLKSLVTAARIELATPSLGKLCSILLF